VELSASRLLPMASSARSLRVLPPDAPSAPPRHERATAVAAFLLVLTTLGFMQERLHLRALLLDRFVPGAGWVEAVLLAVYAALVTRWLLDERRVATWRVRLWLLFSVVFFAQLGLGLLGFSKFLMTGALHVPVPAVIVAGPVFRGGGFFMPVLFGVTLLLVGPAWCSQLCYFGAWDNLAANALPRAKKTPGWMERLRWVSLALVVLVAIGLRAAGVPGIVAAGFGIGFGIGGVGFIVLWSRRKGVMTQCVAYCPIGALAATFGRVSPFRLEIGDGCDECRLCSLVCRYRALEMEDLRRKRAGGTCTLCGDCLASCHSGLIRFRFLGLSPTAARATFVALIAAFHAVFLGVARI